MNRLDASTSPTLLSAQRAVHPVDNSLRIGGSIVARKEVRAISGLYFNQARKS